MFIPGFGGRTGALGSILLSTVLIGSTIDFSK